MYREKALDYLLPCSNCQRKQEWETPPAREIGEQGGVAQRRVCHVDALQVERLARRLMDQRLPEQLDIGCRDGQHEASLYSEGKGRANRSVGLLPRDTGVVLSHCIVPGGEFFAVEPVIEEVVAQSKGDSGE